MSEWRKCTTCKKSIAYLAPYWICNVSTCQRKRIGLVFCGMNCWDAHVPVFRHKECWAEERKAPSEREWKDVLDGKREDMTYPKRERPPEAEPEFKKKPVDPNAPIVVIRRRPGTP